MTGPEARQYRLSACLSLKEAGARAGISASHLSALEKGHKRMTAPMALRIANALGLTVDVALGDES